MTTNFCWPSETQIESLFQRPAAADHKTDISNFDTAAMALAALLVESPVATVFQLCLVFSFHIGCRTLHLLMSSPRSVPRSSPRFVPRSLPTSAERSSPRPALSSSPGSLPRSLPSPAMRSSRIIAARTAAKSHQSYSEKPSVTCQEARAHRRKH